MKIYLLYGNVPIWIVSSTQKAGARFSRSVGFYDPALVPDPVAWLFEKLGELADWDTDAEGPDGSAKARPIPDLATITVMPDADKLAPLAHPQRVMAGTNETPFWYA